MTSRQLHVVTWKTISVYITHRRLAAGRRNKLLDKDDDIKTDEPFLD